MSRSPVSRRRRVVPRVLLAATLAWGLAACSGSADTADGTPEQTLAAAKKTLDQTSGLHVVLRVTKLPPGVSGIIDADGIATHAPAYKGNIKVATGGLTAVVPVVSVDGTVHAKLPFTTQFAPINPGDYGAPDPAALMSRTTGLSSLLTAATDVNEGPQVRDGADVLRSYDATVPGSVVSSIIPSARADGSFTVSFLLTQDNRLAQAVLTGPFYPRAPDVTYTVVFDQYDTQLEITAP